MTRTEKIRSWALSSSGILAVVLSLIGLAILLTYIFWHGIPGLTLDFLKNFPSRFPARAGIFSAIVGTLWVMAFTALFSIPVGIATAVYLEEFASDSRWMRLIRLNIANLSGVPSIVYGMLGLAIFVRTLGLGRSIVSGALTMSLLILPIIIIAAVEALRAVPDSLRMGAFGVGATRRQVVLNHVLPEAIPGMLTGIILALSRAIGESAPLILIGALSFVAFTPDGPMDSFTVLAIQIFNWADRPQAEFQALAASAIIVLLAITLGMNGLAIGLRLKMARKKGAR